MQGSFTDTALDTAPLPGDSERARNDALQKRMEGVVTVVGKTASAGESGERKDEAPE